MADALPPDDAEHLPEVQPDPARDPDPAARQPLRPTAKTAAPKTKKARWGRRILIGAAVILLLLVGLVALLPTLLSTGAGKSLATNVVNGRIPGKIQINDWSLGWFSGTSINGLKLFDQQGALIFELNKLTTELTLTKALRGVYALGKTSADANLTKLVLQPDGRTNYEDALGLARTDPNAPAKPASKLPDASGDLSLALRGHVDSVVAADPKATPPTGQSVTSVEIKPSTVNAKLDGINRPIENDAKLAFAVAGTDAGTLTASGTLDAIENNQIDLAALKADEKVSTNGINLAALQPLLARAGLDLTAAGTLDGGAQVKAAGTTGTLAGTFTVTNAALSGKLLNGDTLKFANVSVPVDVKIDSAAPGATKITFTQFAVKLPDGNGLNVTGVVDQQSLARAANGKAPGAAGNLTVAADFPKFGEIARQLPNTLAYGKDVTIDTAAINNALTLTLTDQLVKLSNNLTATAAGTRGGKPVKLAPITAAAAATVNPGDKLLDRLTDLSAQVSSSFANADFQGATVPALRGTATVDLAKARDAALQFGYLETTELAGQSVIKIDPALANATVNGGATAVATITTTDLHYKAAPTPAKPPATQPAAPPALDLPWSVVKAAVWSDPASPAQVTKANVTAQAGDAPGDVKLDLVADADGITTASAPAPTPAAPDGTATVVSVKSLDLKKLNVSDLPWLVGRAGGYVALPEGVSLAKGELYSHTKLSYDGASKTVTLLDPLEVSTPHLTVVRNGVTALNEENLHIYLGGTVALPDSGLTADLTALSVKTKGDLLKIEKADGPLKIATLAGGQMTGQGKVNITADVAQALALASAAPADPNAPRLTAGKFDGSLALSTEGQAVLAKLVGQLTGLNVTTPTQPITNETVALDFNVKGTNGLADLAADGTLKSSFVNAVVKSLQINRGDAAATDPLYGIRSADATVDAASLSKLYALYNAFVPPTPPAPGEAAAAPVPPIDVKSGSLKADLLVKRDGQKANVNVNATADGIAAGRGGAYTEPFNVTVKTDANYDPAGALDLKTLTLALGDALGVNATGKIVDPTGKREFQNFGGTLSYDLEKLKPLLIPLTAPASRQTLTDATLVGKFEKPFTVGGSYPATAADGQAIRSLAAALPLAADRVDYSGADVRDFYKVATLKDGKAFLAEPATGATKATLNGGELNVPPTLVLDLTAPDTRLSLVGGERARLVVGAKLNPILSSQIGKFLGPQFANATKATGLVDLTLLNADAVAVGEKLYTTQSGSAKVALSIRNLLIENTLWSNAFGGVVQAVPGLGAQASRYTSLEGGITDAVITLANGEVTEDLTFNVLDPATGGGDRSKADSYPLTFAGGVGLSDLKLNNFKMEFPRKLLSNWFGGDVDKVLGYLPEQVPVSLVGSASSPQAKFDAGKLLQGGLKNLAGKELDKATGGKLGDNADGGQKPQSPADALGGLLDGLGKKKDKKK